MRNAALLELEGLLGEWNLTLSNAFFLESMDTEVHGWATIDWLDDSFLRFRGSLGDEHNTWDFVIGRSDARDEYKVLYHDERGVCRLFDMTFAGGEWTMTREDPDFHQRFIGTVEPARITGRWEASDDFGGTWRKDFDLTFERR